MIDPARLLADLRPLVRSLEDDLRERSTSVAEVGDALLHEHAAATAANRTADAYEVWRDDSLTQVAVAWVLGSVFVRFLEDTSLIPEPRLAGPGDRLQRARDHHILYFRQHPMDTDREYLQAVFREVAALPAAGGLFDERHNPLWQVGPSGDGATRLLEFWQRIDPATGALVHDFADPSWNTRFLGDLYQDLSEAARKKYALLQTPEFVEEFILDRTLTPAIEEFGYREVTLLDPTCGSGHFLLGGFHRLFRLWARYEPAVNARELAQRALDQVYGVDLNPFAVAIARFRLLVAALQACDVTQLQDAPGFKINVATGDSLLHGHRFTATSGSTPDLYADDPLKHVYQAEGREELARILGRQYHAVVGNPPYITVKDRALNQAYRDRYGSCSGKYSLVVPFMERFFELALCSSGGASSPPEASAKGGYVGMITGNSFMKREFGKKLIEQYIPRWDLTHVIDTSGAYIPGHGTPTVILFGRHQPPVGDSVRAVMGIRGEAATPEDPARGLVWTAIVSQIDHPGSVSEYVSVADAPREGFHRHPWSIGGGGAAELKVLLDETASTQLGQIAEAIGITSVTGEDDLYVFPDCASLERLRIEHNRQLVTGDKIRDWSYSEPDSAIWLYNDDFQLLPLQQLPATLQLFWRYRQNISKRKRFGTPMLERGLTWYEWQELYTEKLRTPFAISFAEVATHNHFVFDRGGKVFKQTAPVIKLPPDATEDDHLGLLGLLNSSVACFWLKQVAHSKGSGGINEGLRGEKWEFFYQVSGTVVQAFPVSGGRPVGLAQQLHNLAAEFDTLLGCGDGQLPTAELLRERQHRGLMLRGTLIAMQEELDWECYRLYALTDESLTAPISVPACPPGSLNPDTPAPDVPHLGLGERAFEIVMARKMAASEVSTTSFDRHGSTTITELPAHWPESYRRLVEARIRAIETNPHIRLIEQPEYKRRWNSEPWETQQERALRGWLLDRLEQLVSGAGSRVSVTEPVLTTCARLTDRVRHDADFLQVAELYRGRPDFDLTALVAELVVWEAVPFLPVLRYKDTGLCKRELWERTWELQREEDGRRVLGVGVQGAEGTQSLPTPNTRHPTPKPLEIPVPPKYTSADFLNPVFWRLRGKLDVPSERFVSYPHCERDADPTPVIAWAGWDHLQQAQALAAYYVSMKETEGWTAERLTPLLAGLLELLPWLKQWHNEIDPTHNLRMGDYFADFVTEEARALGVTTDQIRAWKPPAKRGRRKG